MLALRVVAKTLKLAFVVQRAEARVGENRAVGENVFEGRARKEATATGGVIPLTDVAGFKALTDCTLIALENLDAVVQTLVRIVAVGVVEPDPVFAGLAQGRALVEAAEDLARAIFKAFNVAGAFIGPLPIKAALILGAVVEAGSRLRRPVSANVRIVAIPVFPDAVGGTLIQLCALIVPAANPRARFTRGALIVAGARLLPRAVHTALNEPCAIAADGMLLRSVFTGMRKGFAGIGLPRAFDAEAAERPTSLVAEHDFFHTLGATDPRDGVVVASAEKQ